MEKLVLDYWQADSTFQASSTTAPTPTEFVFYDGPPSPTDCHYGHLLTGYVKGRRAALPDLARQKVERRFGWDTHGLPAELRSRTSARHHRQSEIETMGVGSSTTSAAIRCCYTGEWRSYVTRRARWVDFDNDYPELDLDFMGR